MDYPVDLNLFTCYLVFLQSAPLIIKIYDTQKNRFLGIWYKSILISTVANLIAPDITKGSYLFEKVSPPVELKNMLSPDHFWGHKRYFPSTYR